MTERFERLRARAAQAGQEHVFAFWDQLDEAARTALLDQVEAVDFELVRELAELQRTEAPPAAAVSFEPPELFPLQRSSEEERAAEEARAEGTRLLSEGAVAYCLVAGGQASRLGYSGPKGDFPIGPVTGRTLFEFHARRLLAARERHGAPVPWYVMTSAANDAETRRIFAAAGHFGLPPEDVFFFSQDMLPALDEEGRILLAERGRLFTAPNGHGGVLQALATSGALDDMERRGVRTLSYFQVDNPLARPADPLFLGLHSAAAAGMSSKVVSKRDPDEKVGVLGRADGAMGCIEYSDLPEDLRRARDEEGELLFRAGNIAVHLLEVDFVRSLTGARLELPWHLARKKIAALDAKGRPAEVAGVKFETFVFDALSRSSASVTLEVDRAEEFSPVKNAEGQDSPHTTKRDLCKLFAGWVREAGGELPAPAEHGEPPVEVDPLLAETLDEFLAAEAPEPKVDEAGHYYGS